MTEAPPLVSVEWLRAHLDDPGVRVVDVSVIATPPAAQGEAWAVRPARAEWEQGHIPGAAFADLVSELSDPTAPFPYTAPSAAQADPVLERLGLDEETHVVLYDGQLNSFASRARLVLRHLGLTRVSVLDGGLPAWIAAGGGSSIASQSLPRGTFRARAGGSKLVGRDAVVNILEDRSAQLVNALRRSQWDGTEINSYVRRGQIPGSTEVAAIDLVDAESGRFVELEQARELFDGAGVKLDEPIVVYCGGGVSASKAALVLEALGAHDVRVYDGSLSEWSADPNLPLTEP